MFLTILFAMSVGIILGIITGLTPGIHVNLVSVMLLSISGILISKIGPLAIAVIIISMAVIHTFLDTIPSIFLGVPEEDTALSMLPGHRLLIEGRGFEATMLTVFGSLMGLIIACLCIPFLLYLVSWIYPIIKTGIGWVLLIVSIFMIFRENNKIWAVLVFSISGVLGLVTLKLPINEPLFPLLSGLFGISMLLLSLQRSAKIPLQEISSIEIKGSYKAIICAVVVGWFASFLPGLGPAHAAVIGSQFVKLTNKTFLILVGALSTVNMVLSMVTFYVLDKARNGAIVAVQQIIEISHSDFLILISVALIVGGVGTIIAIRLTKSFSKLILKVDYVKLCLGIVLLIISLVCLISGYLGLVILIVASAVGIIPVVKGVSRSQMMGCLMVPVIGYFLF